ncbi:contactin-2-like isoform X1 [Temnothorax curvispinosus]|uniref:Contactin-2-like isoform X1 n=2 Tax=Temnothorax TaxID=300110 RepID=A0A6J1QKK0_9HYME|nr:contactin-2-like isoform X1 [Temnothorax curvispinosus]XP_024882987.1 contactin-2-like isoform X1 [Temnothorax curvispinosus]
MDERKLLPLLMLFLAGWQEAVAVVPMRHVAVDVGSNMTLACTEDNDLPHSKASNVMWIREGREDGQIERLKVEPNGMLKLLNVSVDDAGNYSCTFDDDLDTVKTMINVTVRTPPSALQNVWVKPSTILANILWEVGYNGGYPIIDFTAEYRLKPVAGEEPEEWKPISPIHIPPNSRQIDVYHLMPNTTYSFRVWATNQLGKGEVVEVEGHTQYTIEEFELERHLLAGVENFDPRVWVAAVGIVMGTLMILGLGTCYLLYRECKAPSQLEEQEVIELVPNIILNPGFFDERTEHVPQDENFNNQTTTRLNNNSVVQPRRL